MFDSYAKIPKFFLWDLSAINFCLCISFISTIYECFGSKSIIFIESFEEINSSIIIPHSIFNPRHIRNQFELNTFPFEKPAKLFDPFFSQNSACYLQNLNIMFCLDVLDLFGIIVGLIVHPKDDILHECNW